MTTFSKHFGASIENAQSAVSFSVSAGFYLLDDGPSDRKLPIFLF